MKRSKFDLMVFMIPEFFNGMIRIPDIQRENTAWTLTQKQSLIDTLYNDFDVPKIYFRNKEENEGIWWLIDGQQRLTTIKDFLQDKFILGHFPTLPRSIRGKKYSELEQTDKERINRRILDCVIIECTEEEEEDMFVRLNNGTPLTVSEKRNAVKGEFRDSIRTLTEHPFFAQGKFNFSSKRFAVDVLCAQLSVLVMHNMPALNSKTLDHIYDKYKEYPQRKQVESKVKGILDWMDQIFDQKEKFLKKSTIITFFALLRFLSEHVELNDLPPEELRKFFREFEEAKQANGDLDAGSPHLDRELLDYQIHLNKGAYSAESLNKRIDILKNRFTKAFPQIELQATLV